MSRETHGAEKNALFRHLKSLPRESLKLWSITHCSSAISPQETSLQRENYRGFGHAVDRFVRGSRAASTVPPAQSRPSTRLRISELWYDSPIKKEYGSQVLKTFRLRGHAFREFPRAEGGAPLAF
jgi:hypothetical protein